MVAKWAQSPHPQGQSIAKAVAINVKGANHPTCVHASMCFYQRLTPQCGPCPPPQPDAYSEDALLNAYISEGRRHQGDSIEGSSPTAPRASSTQADGRWVRACVTLCIR